MLFARHKPRYTAEQTHKRHDHDHVVHGSAGNCRHVSDEYLDIHMEDISRTWNSWGKAEEHDGNNREDGGEGVDER
jgi:hypothetical protein